MYKSKHAPTDASSVLSGNGDVLKTEQEPNTVSVFATQHNLPEEVIIQRRTSCLRF